MIRFGCYIKNMEFPKRIIGIKKIKGNQHMEQELVRRPSSLKNSVLSRFVSVDGILPNVLLAIVHFALILIVPLVSPIVTYLALCEQTVF
jgi:hypothetical protein